VTEGRGFDEIGVPVTIKEAERMLEPQKTVEQLADLRGAAVYDNCGERIGRVEEIYDDKPTAEPLWIGIESGFLGMKQVVPFAGARTSPDGVTVRYSKEQVKDSPEIDIHRNGISVESERDLYGYYGFELEPDFDTGLTDTSLQSELPDRYSWRR
jgi:sporulation protein YlmC with PRC-barrel domain